MAGVIPGQVQEWKVPATQPIALPQMPMGQMQVYDPLSVFVMLAFAPMYALFYMMSAMQRMSVMPMQGMMGGPGASSGYKVIGIRRDDRGNIVEIFEKW